MKTSQLRIKAGTLKSVNITPINTKSMHFKITPLNKLTATYIVKNPV